MATVTLSLVPHSTLTPLGGVLLTPVDRPGPPVILADYIDPETHDFASMLYTLDAIDAQVIVALQTERGSGASVQDDGQRLKDIRHIRDSIENDIRSAIERALSRLVTNRDIDLRAVDNFDIDKSNQQVECMISWFNRRDKSTTPRSLKLLIAA